MTPPVTDSSEVEDTLMVKLDADPTLRALMPDGVWWDLASQDARRFVIVSLVDHADVATFGRRTAEDYLLLVKAVALQGTGIRAAARRLDELLQDGRLAPAGFALQAMFRERRIRYTETDDANPSIRWRHRGGYYRVQVAIAAADAIAA